MAAYRVLMLERVIFCIWALVRNFNVMVAFGSQSVKCYTRVAKVGWYGKVADWLLVCTKRTVLILYTIHCPQARTLLI